MFNFEHGCFNYNKFGQEGAKNHVLMWETNEKN